MILLYVGVKGGEEGEREEREKTICGERDVFFPQLWIESGLGQLYHEGYFVKTTAPKALLDSVKGR